MRIFNRTSRGLLAGLGLGFPPIMGIVALVIVLGSIPVIAYALVVKAYTPKPHVSKHSA
jgi:hypothetical protein